MVEHSEGLALERIQHLALEATWATDRKDATSLRLDVAEFIGGMISAELRDTAIYEFTAQQLVVTGMLGMAADRLSARYVAAADDDHRRWLAHAIDLLQQASA